MFSALRNVHFADGKGADCWHQVKMIYSLKCQEFITNVKSNTTLTHINVCNFKETMSHCWERESFSYVGVPGFCAEPGPTGPESSDKHEKGGLDVHF